MAQTGICQALIKICPSPFAVQFKMENIAVMKKNKGKSQYIKISDSRALMDNLADFGTEELELMHRNDEMEGLA